MLENIALRLATYLGYVPANATANALQTHRRNRVMQRAALRGIRATRDYGHPHLHLTQKVRK